MAAARRAVPHKPHTHRHVAAAAQDTQGGTERPSERAERDCPIDLVTALARALARPPAPCERALGRATTAAAAATPATDVTKDPLPGHVDPSEQRFAHMEELREDKA